MECPSFVFYTFWYNSLHPTRRYRLMQELGKAYSILHRSVLVEKCLTKIKYRSKKEAAADLSQGKFTEWTCRYKLGEVP